MLGASVKSKLQAFDVYQRLPNHLTEPTMSGAIVSVLSITIIFILFFSEYLTYSTPKVFSDMNVNQIKESRDIIKMSINIDIPFTPCDILSFEGADLSGSKEIHLTGDLKKYRMDANGNTNEVDKQNGFSNGNDNFDFERAKRAFTNQEGCNFRGYVEIPFLPGTFSVSAKNYNSVSRRFMGQVGIFGLDMSHKINHLSFGNQMEINYLRKQFPAGVFAVLDESQLGLNDPNFNRNNRFRQELNAYNYYLSLVPSEFRELNGNTYQAYQFTANHLELPSSSNTLIQFRYDISPVMARFYQEKQGILHFIVQICAIIGGVFTVAGIIDSLVHQSVVHILKKAQMNKLS